APTIAAFPRMEPPLSLAGEIPIHILQPFWDVPVAAYLRRRDRRIVFGTSLADSSRWERVDPAGRGGQDERDMAINEVLRSEHMQPPESSDLAVRAGASSAWDTLV